MVHLINSYLESPGNLPIAKIHMPVRLLRDITDSEKVDMLTANAEVLFYRLMMKADDYGSFHANVKLIKANCFPLRLDTVRDADISRWMDELQKAGLIVVYKNAGKMYLRINNFGQRLRNKRKKFPEFDGKSPQVAASGGQTRPEVEEEVEEEVEGSVPVEADPFFYMFRKVAGKHISDSELMDEIAKFTNKYPNAHPNTAGALINTWVANIGRAKPIAPKDKNSFV